MNDLIGGHLPLSYTSLSTAGPHVQSGGAKMLGIPEPERFIKLPDTPSISEALPALQKPLTWFGLFVARGTPDPIVKRLNAEIAKIIETRSIAA